MSQQPPPQKYTLSAQQLSEIYDFSIDLSHRAGEILLEGVERRCAPPLPRCSSSSSSSADGGRGSGGGGRIQELQVDKDSSVDIVTETDFAVEAFVKERISERFPEHDFLGEESYSKGSSKDYLITNKPCWCVDPLDGTVNYTHLFPMFCISIAFCLNGIPVVGVIYAPLLNTTYSACIGQGAWQVDSRGIRKQLPLVREPIPPLPAQAPKGCVFSCEWGKDRKDVPGGNMSKKISSFMNMAAEIGGRGGKGGMVHGVRSLGSATLDLAYVATGATDIWWEGGCWEWDVAAGICILREAGGLITCANAPAGGDGVIPEVRLGSRLYLAIRPAGPAEDGESGREGQERVVREVWKRVEQLDYTRPGA